MALSVAEKSKRWRDRHPEQFAIANRARARCWELAHPDEVRERLRIYRETHADRHIRRDYGLTREGYDAILVEQGGVCGACGRPETAVRGGVALRLAVDHIHGTDIIRGLLCGRCNRGIGNFDDDPDRLEAAARYLRSRKT